MSLVRSKAAPKGAKTSILRAAVSSMARFESGAAAEASFPLGGRRGPGYNRRLHPAYSTIFAPGRCLYVRLRTPHTSGFVSFPRARGCEFCVRPERLHLATRDPDRDASPAQSGHARTARRERVVERLGRR